MKASERDDIRNRYQNVETSNVADVLDTMGYFDQSLHPSFSSFTGPGRLAGWAYTIRGQMTPYPLGGDAEKMRACEGISQGEISVWSGNGEGICCFGELIAIGMKERGSVGSLIDGGIRDIRWINQQKIPVFARYRTPTQSIGRWKVNAWQIPIKMPGATSHFVNVTPGDFILGDEDGVIVIPAAVAVEVLAKAEQLTAIEVSIRSELTKGLSLSEALAKYGHV